MVISGTLHVAVGENGTILWTVATPEGVMFADGFEPGDVPRWARTGP